jgi:hypothetical protein
MKRINVWYFYALGSAIEPLKNFTPTMDWADLSMAAMYGGIVLDKLDQSVCRKLATSLAPFCP